MAEHPPNIFPSLRFADADAALEWMTGAFGFEQRAVYRSDDGVVQHAELSLGAGTIMLGQGDPASHGIYVVVDDADAHYERAKAAGTEITRELEDTPYGSREYSARDLDGHIWSFGTYKPEARE